MKKEKRVNPVMAKIRQHQKEFKNSERRTRVPFTPEEDSFIRKGIKKDGFGYWMEILRSFKANFRGSRTVDSIKKRAEKLLGEQN